MKGTSKVIMGATLVMVVSLAVVLGLILVLLAELYCSLLLRRRHLLRRNNPNTTTAATPQPTTATPSSSSSSSSYSPSQHAPHRSPPPPPFNNSNVYSQGVLQLQVPRTFLFPSNIASVEEPNSNSNANRIGLVSVPSPLASFISRAPPKQVQEEDPLQGTASETALYCHDPIRKSYVGEEEQQHHLVYISNPIYENEEGNLISAVDINTPFETPDTSPSRLEGSVGGGSSGDEDDMVVCVPLPYTPPLTPMKKLPTEACSVSLRDGRSLVGTSASDSRSNNGISSSSSVSPRTSPSW